MADSRDFSKLRTLPRPRRDALIAAFERSLSHVSESRLQRFVDILRRNVFATESPKALYSELGISKRRFFSERREVLRKLDPLLGVTDELPPSDSNAVQVRDVSGIKLLQARAMFAAGNSSRSGALLETLDESRLEPGDRFDALRLTIDALYDTRKLQSGAASLKHRIGRWAEDSAEGSTERNLASAAAEWLGAKLAVSQTGYHRESLLHATQAAALLRTTLAAGNRSMWISYCRVLMETAALSMNLDDCEKAKSQLREVQRALQTHDDLTPVLATEELAMCAQVSWSDPTKLRASRTLRATAYALALEGGDPRSAWQCLYFDILDRFLRRDQAGALASAKELARSVEASESLEWRTAAQGMLARAYFNVGQLEDANRMTGQARGLNDVALDLVGCRISTARDAFSESLTKLAMDAHICEERGLTLPWINAVEQRAETAYRMGKFGEAAAAIEDAVALSEARGSHEPYALRRLYEGALLMTGRRRYRDALGDIESTLRRSEPVANKPREPGGLTGRQFQIAHLAAAGRSNSGIAQHLRIGSRTVRWHLDAIFAHFNIQSRFQLPDVMSSQSENGARAYLPALAYALDV